MLCSALFVLAAILGVWAEPVVSPKRQQVKEPANAQVLCVFPKPLQDCRLRVTSSYYKQFDTTLDFQLGAQSPIVSLHRGSLTASYAGDGLGTGQCGVLLGVRWRFVLLVECHGQDVDGDWTSGFGLVMSSVYAVLAVTMATGPLTVARPGDHVAVSLKARGALDLCYIYTPAEGEVDLEPGQSPPDGSRYRVHGAGAAQGECGASLENVTQRDAGVWFWWGDQGDPVSMQATVLLVQVAPEGEPELVVKDGSRLRVGHVLEASCRAPPGVPPASLSWLLGGREVRSDDGNRTLAQDVFSSRPWQPRPVMQTFTRRLTAEDLGKRLECRMGHSALTANRSVGLDLPATAASSVTPRPTTPRPTTPRPTTPTQTKPTQTTPTQTTPTQTTPSPRPTTPTQTTPTPPSLSTCPALATRSVRVRCSLSGADVDCVNAPAPLGATALVECRAGYKPQGTRSAFHTTTCKARGRWGPKPLVCQLDAS